MHTAELYGSRVAHIVKGYEPIIIILGAMANSKAIALEVCIACF